MTFDLSILWPWLPVLGTGLLWTILITILAGVISVVVGIVVAVLVLYGGRIISWPVRSVMFIFMGTPLLLQLYLFYYGLSEIGILIPAFWTGVIGLGLHYAAYNADIFRAALANVDHGQTEAARTLGFGRMATLRYFTLPQAFLTAMPQLGNNSIILLKDTALVSVLGVADLVLNAQRGISETFRPFEFYFAAAVLYYLINLVMEYALARVAKKTEAIR